MTELKPIIDTAALIAEEEHYERIANVEEHLHPKDQSGTSNIPKCDYLVALKTVNIPLPKIPKESVKAKKGAMQEGNDLHEVKQDRLIRRCQRKALEQGYMYCPEVYNPLKVYNKTGKLIVTLVSPMDNYYALPNAEGKIVEMQFIDFKNMPIQKPVIAPGSTPIQVDDIKTMSNWAFKKFLKGEMSFNYECQFHTYMAMIEKDILWVYAIQKETGENAYKSYRWNGEVWEELVMILERKKDLIAHFEHLLLKNPNLSYNEIIPNNPKNLGCLLLEHDNIDWWSCELSTTEEYHNARAAKTTQRLTKPCKAAQHYMMELYHERFPIGSLWVRRDDDPLKWGKYVTILSTENGNIHMQRWTISKAKGSYKQWSWGKEDTFFTDDPVKAWVGLKPITIKCVHETCPRGYPRCAYEANKIRNCPEHQIEIVK